MVCCGNTACRQCITTKMIKNPQNAERGIAQKGSFECSACKSKYYSNDDSNKPFIIQPNITIKNIIASNKGIF